MKKVTIYKGLRISRLKNGLYGIYKGRLACSIYWYRTIKECKEEIRSWSKKKQRTTPSKTCMDHLF